MEKYPVERDTIMTIHVQKQAVVTHSTLLPWSSPEQSEEYHDAKVGDLVNVPKFKPSTCLIWGARWRSG